jgi:ankyrin repeat protein
MPLSDLPKETLLDIDDAGLNTLSRSNKQVYDLLNRFLYYRDLTKSQGRSLLWGVKNGVESTVQRALAAGRHLNPIPKCYYIAFEHAADHGCTHLVKLLLEIDGINPNLVSPEWESFPLILAAEGGHSTVVELLLATVNVDPNVKDLWKSASALHCACKKGNVSIVKQLLARGDIDVNSRDQQSFSPLHWAVVPGVASNADVIKLLLDREDIDVNQQHQSGRTALAEAASYNSIEAAKLLLGRHDIKQNLPDNNGWTPLFWACNQKECLPMVDLLLENDGVDPNARDNNGRTPLAHACLLGYVDIAHSLLSHPDTNPNAVDSNGVSILAHVKDRITPQYGGEIESLLRESRDAGAR